MLVTDSKYAMRFSPLALVTKIWCTPCCYVYNCSGTRIDVSKSLLLSFGLINQFHTCRIYLESNYIVESDNAEKRIESYLISTVHLLKHLIKAVFQRLIEVSYPRTITLNRPAIMWVFRCTQYLSSLILKSWWNRSPSSILRYPRFSGKWSKWLWCLFYSQVDSITSSE